MRMPKVRDSCTVGGCSRPRMTGKDFNIRMPPELQQKMNKDEERFSCLMAALAPRIEGGSSAGDASGAPALLHYASALLPEQFGAAMRASVEQTVETTVRKVMKDVMQEYVPSSSAAFNPISAISAVRTQPGLSALSPGQPSVAEGSQATILDEPGRKKRKQRPAGGTDVGVRCAKPRLQLPDFAAYLDAYRNGRNGAPALHTTAARTYYDITSVQFAAQLNKAKTLHEATKRREDVMGNMSDAMLDVIRVTRPHAQTLHVTNLQDLIKAVNRERQSLHACAKFEAGDITNPAVMQPPEFESAIRSPLSPEATTALRSLCCDLYGTCATAKSAARASLQRNTPSHVASFLLSGKEFTLWA